jgi:hypothetical protein
MWLPLARLIAILCCCMRPLRNFVCLAIPTLCEFACCCCSAACARVGRCLCYPRARPRVRARRFENGKDADDAPSIELLSVTVEAA